MRRCDAVIVMGHRHGHQWETEPWELNLLLKPFFTGV